MARPAKLKARWGKVPGEKQKDVVFDGPNSWDMRYLAYKILSEEVLKELANRGYDLTTLRFEIARKMEEKKDA